MSMTNVFLHLEPGYDLELNNQNMDLKWYSSKQFNFIIASNKSKVSKGLEPKKDWKNEVGSDPAHCQLQQLCEKKRKKR